MHSTDSYFSQAAPGKAISRLILLNENSTVAKSWIEDLRIKSMLCHQKQPTTQPTEHYHTCLRDGTPEHRQQSTQWGDSDTVCILALVSLLSETPDKSSLRKEGFALALL